MESGRHAADLASDTSRGIDPKYHQLAAVACMAGGRPGPVANAIVLEYPEAKGNVTRMKVANLSKGIKRGVSALSHETWPQLQLDQLTSIRFLRKDKHL